MCFFRKKNVQPVIDENRFYLKVVSNGFYIEIFGYGDPKNQMSIGAGEDKHDHELTEDKFNAIKKVMLEHLDELVELAFDDQCTGANPVYPLMSEIKQIYIDAFNGVV